MRCPTTPARAGSMRGGLEGDVDRAHRCDTLSITQCGPLDLGLLRCMTAGQPVGPAQKEPHQPLHFAEADFGIRTRPTLVTDLLISTR